MFDCDLISQFHEHLLMTTPALIQIGLMNEYNEITSLTVFLMIFEILQLPPRIYLYFSNRKTILIIDKAHFVFHQMNHQIYV